MRRTASRRGGSGVNATAPAAIAFSFPRGGALIAGCGNIGAAVARRLARAGVPLVVTYQKNATRAAELMRELNAQGARVHAQQLDFSDAGAVLEVVRHSAARCGGLHTVAYCAGPAIPFLKVRDMPPETLAQHLQADTLGCFRLFHHAIPVLAAGGGGSLIACVTMANQIGRAHV
jgi:3-oxoacyl-[acyl-carrier protein] reductase